MYIVRRYNDLLIEIQLCNLRIKDLETQIENIDELMIKPPSDVSGIDYSGMPKGSHNYTSLDRYIDLRNKLCNNLNFEYKLFKNLIEQKNQNNEKIKKLEGIEYKISYLKIIKGYSFKQIAEKLGKSEQYIRNVYSKTGRNF